MYPFIKTKQSQGCVHMFRLQAMRNDNLLKDGDWMKKKEALRENLPPNFSNEDIQAKMKEVKNDLHPAPWRSKALGLYSSRSKA